MGELIVRASNRAKDIAKLERKANKGDKKALSKLIEHYDEIPELWREIGDMSRHVILSTAVSIVGDNLAVRECLVRKVAEIKMETAGADPTPLEMLLAERIGVCWIQLQYADAMVNQSSIIAQGDFWQRRLDRTQRRYLSAIKTLALVRRLQLPAVQVNIGEKQVNVVAQDRQLPLSGQDENERR